MALALELYIVEVCKLETTVMPTMYIDFKAVARNYPSHPGAGEYLSDPLFKKRERTTYLHQQLV